MRLFLNFILALAILGCKVPAKNNLPAEIVLEDSAAPFDFYKSDKEMTDEAIQKSEEDYQLRNMVGFRFGIAGTEPPTVEVFRRFLQKKNYDAVCSKLFSSLPAEQYLATVVCERLFQMQLLELTVRETSRIAEIVHSEKEVSVCSGCTVISGITLKDLFGKEYKSLRPETEEWLQELIK